MQEKFMRKPCVTHLDRIGSFDVGYISIIEHQKEINFAIERVYWTYFTPNHVVRGHHAHKTLEQVIVAVSGIIEFELEDKEEKKYSFTLDKPSLGLYIPPGVWRTIRFSHNAVLLCLASKKYEEEDYIRNYSEYKHYCRTFFQK